MTWVFVTELMQAPAKAFQVHSYCVAYEILPSSFSPRRTFTLYQSRRCRNDGGDSPEQCHRQKRYWAAAPMVQSIGSLCRMAPIYSIFPNLLVLPLDIFITTAKQGVGP